MSHTPAKVAGGYFNSHRDQIASIRLFTRTSTHAECATHDGSSRRSWKRVRVHMYVVDEQELLLRPDLQPDAVHHNPRIYAQEHTQYEARETVCLWVFGDQFTAGQNAVVARKVCSPTQVGRPSKTGAPVLSPGYVPSQPGPGRIPGGPPFRSPVPPQSPSRLPPPPPHPTANRTSSLLPSHVRIAHHGRALPSSIAIHLPTITRWTHVRNRELVHIRRRYCLELHQVKFRYAMLNTAPWKCTLACGTPMPTCWCPGPSSQPRLLTLHQDEQMSRP